METATITELKNYSDLMNVGVASLALLVSVVSIVVALAGLWFQRRHNYKSLAPLPWISLADYEDRLSVKIFNNGVGPLIIDRIEVFNGTESKPNVIDWLADVPTMWTTFISELRNRSIGSGQSLTLLEWEADPNHKAPKVRDACRSHLRSLRLVMHSHDIYQRPQPICERSFEWFGRNLPGTPTISPPQSR